MTLESQAVETDPFPFTHISETRGDAHANLVQLSSFSIGRASSKIFSFPDHI